MKQAIFFTASVLFSLFCFAAPVNTVLSNGNWTNASSWSLGRLPQTGDTVMIPSGKTLIIKTNINAGNVTLFLKIYGVLELDNGKIDLSAQSKIYVFDGGSIVSTTGTNADAIRIAGIEKYRGSTGTLYGPLYATSTTGTAPSGFETSYYALPVKFIGFTLSLKNNSVDVQWATSEEYNAAYYEVERSVDGTSWTRIATLAAAGTSAQAHHYSFTDTYAAASLRHYRIRQVDKDGRAQYTPIRSIRSEDAAIGISASSGRVLLQFPREAKGMTVVRFVSTNGQVISEQTLNNASGQVILTARHTGTCIISISGNSGVQAARQVML